MAKSSINFEKAHKGSLHHNDRTQKKEVEYLLPIEYRLENEIDRSAKEGYEFLQLLIDEARKNFYNKFKQKLQARSYVWEAIVNLNKEHNLSHVQKLVKELEAETGFTSIQIAIHRDEGHINERGITEYNLHAHLTFFTLDKITGQQLYRRNVTDKQKKAQPNLEPMNRKRLSKIQDITAQSLGMVRGKKGSTSVRLGHKAYRASKNVNKSLDDKSTAQIPKKLSKRQIESLSAIYANGGDKPFVKKYPTRYPTPEEAYPKSLPIGDKKYPSKKATKVELAQAKALLRAEMQEAGGYGRPEYALMEQKYKELKEKLKGKDLTISELEQANNALRVELKLVNEYNSEIEAEKEILEEEVAEKDLIIQELENDVERLQRETKEILLSNTSLEEKITSIKAKKDEFIKSLEDDITRAREETKEVLIEKMGIEDELEELQEEYGKLKKAYNYLKDKYEKFVNKFKKDNTDELHLRDR